MYTLLTAICVSPAVLLGLALWPMLAALAKLSIMGLCSLGLCRRIDGANASYEVCHGMRSYATLSNRPHRTLVTLPRGLLAVYIATRWLNRGVWALRAMIIGHGSPLAYVRAMVPEHVLSRLDKFMPLRLVWARAGHHGRRPLAKALVL